MSQDKPHSTVLRNLWEEVDSLPEGGRYDVTISFENLTPEAVSWLVGNMNSYIHMARIVDIEPVN